MGKACDTYGFWCGRPGGKRPLGKPRSRWQNNIKMDLKEVEWEHESD